MEKVNDFFSLKGTVLSRVDTPLGYMQLLEYVLQDSSYLHILQWHFNSENDVDKDTLLPLVHTITFYRDKAGAQKRTYEIGEMLLLQF